MSRSLLLLYGLIGCLGLVLASLPQLAGLILFEGEFGALVADILGIVSSIGYYGMLIFSGMLIAEAAYTLRSMYRR